MASSTLSKQKPYDSCWTPKQNKVFEKALAKYDKDTPDRWHNVAKAIGGKSEDDVKRHCQILLEDLRHIESGHVPIPIYKSTPTTFPLSTTRTGYHNCFFSCLYQKLLGHPNYCVKFFTGVENV